MSASSRPAAVLATILALAVPGLTFAGDLRLTFLNGRVTLVAQDVPIREILAEWERVGGTRVVNPDAAPAASVTLDLSDVPEARALDILLRQAAGYFASDRSTPAETSSRFTRIVIMPGADVLAAAPPAPADARPSGPPAGARVSQRAQVQQHTMPDPLVASVVEEPAQPVETPVVADDVEIPELPVVEVPANLASPLTSGTAPVTAGANAGPNPALTARGLEGRTAVPVRASPTVPATTAVAGAVVPGSRPELIPYRPQELPPPPPPPIKPPDD